MLTETVTGFLESRQQLASEFTRLNVRIMIPPSVDTVLNQVKSGIIDSVIKSPNNASLKEKIRLAGEGLDISACGGFIPDSIITYRVLSGMIEESFTATFNRARENPLTSSKEETGLLIGCTDAMYAACSILDRAEQVRQLILDPEATSQTTLFLPVAKPGYGLFESEVLGKMCIRYQGEDKKIFEKQVGIAIVSQLGREVGRVQNNRMNTDPTKGFITRFTILGESIAASTLPELIRRIVG